jgi:hypothetical protein
VAATVSDDLSRDRIDSPKNVLSKKKKNIMCHQCVINVVHIISHDLDSPTFIHRSPDGMSIIS